MSIQSSTSTSREDLAKLAAVARAGLVQVDDAVSALGLSPRKAAARLGALARQGWLSRVQRGLYAIVPLEADPGRPVIPEDPWVLAVEAFSPCYIGGWSAAEHWDLTEQIFRSTLVVTSGSVRNRSPRLRGHEFRLYSVSPDRISGTVLVWRSNERIPVSDRERTIVDAARDPKLVGGVVHLAAILREYGRIPERDDDRLVATAEVYANGAAWKRLGYLAENILPDSKGIIEAAQPRLSAGNAKLEPAIAHRGRLLRRWRLWINAEVTEEGGE